MNKILDQVNAIPERLLRRDEAAEYVTKRYGIPCSPKTLAKLACISSEWAQRKIGPLVQSTSQLRAPAGKSRL
jgi:hypothetical protein